jgi:hypothetical protein
MMRLALDKSRAYQDAVGEQTRNLFTGARLATERQERKEDRKLQERQIAAQEKAQSQARRKSGGIGGLLKAVAPLAGFIPGAGPAISAGLGAAGGIADSFG